LQGFYDGLQLSIASYNATMPPFVNLKLVLLFHANRYDAVDLLILLIVIDQLRYQSSVMTMGKDSRALTVELH
jgi:hypothetical protein